MGGTFSIHGRVRNAYIILGRNPKEKKPFGSLDVDGQMVLK
jgi:hypothetical protein